MIFKYKKLGGGEAVVAVCHSERVVAERSRSRTRRNPITLFNLALLNLTVSRRPDFYSQDFGEMAKVFNQFYGYYS